MFFVTLLLNQVLSWMRAQSGTTSLRAILYMDEIFGYFPPVATPPSKAPLLTLLKQGRAFGLGVVLATQNPVDLDYKGLANTGTWFLGRLQTERDKARVLDGLEGVAAGASQKFDRGKMEQLLAGLGNRVFLLNNVHEDAPEVFETRWALSYLRGPLTRTQIKTLMDPLRAAQAEGAGRESAGRRRGGGGRRGSAAGPAARHPAALRPAAGLRRGRRLSRRNSRNGRGALRRLEERRRLDREGRAGGPGGGNARLVGGRAARVRRRRVRVGARRGRRLCAARSGRGQGEELRRLEQGLRHVDLSRADARAVPERLDRRRFETGGERGGLPLAHRPGRPRGARRGGRKAPPEVRAEAGRAPGAPAARGADGRAREAGGDPGGIADGDLGRCDGPRRALRAQGAFGHDDRQRPRPPRAAPGGP